MLIALLLVFVRQGEINFRANPKLGKNPYKSAISFGLAESQGVAFCKSATINSQTATHLDELFEGKPDAIKHQALVQFLADIREQLGRLDTALASRDINIIEGASHVLVGLAGTFGAGDIARIAGETNTLARSDEDMNAVVAGESLCDACKALLEYSNEHLVKVSEPELEAV